MFLDKKYVLANELVQKMGINIANISVLRKQYEYEDDLTTIVKMNNCNFLNSKSQKLPNNIRCGLSEHEFTDMSNKLPLTYVRSEYGMTEKELLKSGLVLEKIKVGGKDFFVFNDEIVATMKNKIGYVLDKNDTSDCMKRGLIEGYVQLNKNKFFTWYSIGDVGSISREVHHGEYSLGSHND